jgi:deazaflavin-dependent oxidoreductase (nitroreductase family)
MTPAAGGRRSAFWSRWFPVQYRVIRWLDPLVRAWWSRVGLGDTAELTVAGRRTGLPRRVLVGLLDVDGRWYVGHPNGPVAWTRNLDAAGSAGVRRPGRPPVDVRAHPLPAGPERSAAIRATFVQHPFPGDLIYRLAGRHIEAVGAFFRLEPADPDAGAGSVEEDGPGARARV